MNIFTVTTKPSLLAHRNAIEHLFSISFGQRALGEVWDWAYLRNPSGDPIVTLCYDNGNLVGHYAIVPMPLSNEELTKRSYISMTTMVAESHRKFGLFTKMATENYAHARQSGVDFVFGFPNSDSTPGFGKRLNWTLPESDYVVTLDKSAVLHLVADGKLDKRAHLSLDLTIPALREWRLSRPGANYSYDNGIAYKRLGNTLDLLWWEHPGRLVHLPDGVRVNLLLEASSGIKSNRLFDYQFGGLGLCSEFNHSDISREMALSDLF
jgi:hypothetical protein